MHILWPTGEPDLQGLVYLINYFSLRWDLRGVSLSGRLALLLLLRRSIPFFQQRTPLKTPNSVQTAPYKISASPDRLISVIICTCGPSRGVAAELAGSAGTTDVQEFRDIDRRRQPGTFARARSRRKLGLLTRSHLCRKISGDQIGEGFNPAAQCRSGSSGVRRHHLFLSTTDVTF